MDERTRFELRPEAGRDRRRRADREPVHDRGRPKQGRRRHRPDGLGDDTRTMIGEDDVAAHDRNLVELPCDAAGENLARDLEGEGRRIVALPFDLGHRDRRRRGRRLERAADRVIARGHARQAHRAAACRIGIAGLSGERAEPLLEDHDVAGVEVRETAL